MAEFNKNLGYDTQFIMLDRFNEVSSTLVREELKKGDFRHIPPCAIALMMSKEFENINALR